MPSDVLVVPFQVLSLTWIFLSAVLTACVLLPTYIFRIALRRGFSVLNSSAVATHTQAKTTLWYKATVHHARSKPVDHRFSYDVRVAIVDLDDPPAYYDAETNDTMTADKARALAKTRGPVRLLTDPSVGGYVQNPISVYYCYDESDALAICIAEVTNTPWGDRVTFLFDPRGTSVPKVLHVSPLMDMMNVWTLKTKDPRKNDGLYLRVGVDHPELGKYFDAVIEGRVDNDAPYERNETASFEVLLKYGFQPHRIAFWIYWHAVCLLWKGVRFFGPPGLLACQAAAKKSGAGGGCTFNFGWRPAESWTWRERRRKREREKEGERKRNLTSRRSL
jgi:DUF1365 family protein